MSEATTAAPATTTTSTGPASTDGASTAATTTAATTAPATPAAGTTAATTATAAEAKPTGEAATEAEGKPGETKVSEGAPEKYEDFKLADGVKPDPAAMEKFKVLAKERDLSQAEAQKFADIAVEMQTRQTAAIQAMRTSWDAETQADKEIGGDKLAENLATAKKAMTAFCTPAFTELLRTSGLDVHPEMVRTFFRVGKSLSEDNFVPAGTAANGGKSAAELFYPSMQPH